MGFRNTGKIRARNGQHNEFTEPINDLNESNKELKSILMDTRSFNAKIKHKMCVTRQQ
jgi:hypothetical protein